MLKFAVIFVIGLLIVPHIHSQDTTDSTAIIDSTTTDQILRTSLLTEQSTEESVVSTADDTTVPRLEPTTVKVDTTRRPFPPMFECDFTTPCFAENQLDRTDGSQFNLGPISDTSLPPVAPTSDVSSITNPTNDSLPCQLPYRPQLENGTDFANWSMWFCYNNECPTSNETQGTCVSGLYGLVSLNSSESSRTIFDSINSTDSNAIAEDFSEVQCLRFNYYFTVYDGEDWGQEIQVWIRPNHEINNQYSIENFTVADMNENKWQNGEVTFTSVSSNYTLAFSFLVTKENQGNESETNRTIYFALDNIELYAFNCSVLNIQIDSTTPNPVTEPSSAPDATSGVTVTALTTVAESKNSSANINLPLILGLSLGLGIPFVVSVTVGIVYYFAVHRAKINEVKPISETRTTKKTRTTKNGATTKKTADVTNEIPMESRKTRTTKKKTADASDII
ncbi:unnamed protein product [Rotaria socialis]|uniref:MAM domain-containing protein n=1 Tax=Rotaria socialis TaxID=392032 RepID=A0A818I8T1_9BILA|nr:unnamed protein product [Rotaria socialis]CAF3519559.1 unnamed protein product [Rotaria socialis]CAF4408429.1 unnamed protein product [Rotaria socialis]